MCHFVENHDRNYGKQIQSSGFLHSNVLTVQLFYQTCYFFLVIQRRVNTPETYKIYVCVELLKHGKGITTNDGKLSP